MSSHYVNQLWPSWPPYVCHQALINKKQYAIPNRKPIGIFILISQSTDVNFGTWALSCQRTMHYSLVGSSRRNLRGTECKNMPVATCFITYHIDKVPILQQTSCDRNESCVWFDFEKALRFPISNNGKRKTTEIRLWRERIRVRFMNIVANTFQWL